MKKIFILLFLSIFIFGSSQAQRALEEKGSYKCSQRKSAMASVLPSKRSENSPKHKFDVQNYTINIDLFDNFDSPYPNEFDASVVVNFRVDTALNMIKLDAVNSSLTINAVGLAGATFTHTDDTLSITLDQTYDVGDMVDVLIEYEHKDVADGAFYVGSGFVFTDCEPEGARKWFPCYDRPADKAKLNLTAKVPADVMLGSNGRMADSTTVADTTWFNWISRDPIATYIMVMSASNQWDLDIVYWERPSGTLMPIRFYHTPDENPDYMETQIPLVATYFSESYGEHPFEKDGFATLNNQFTWGGMENQSLTSLCDNCWGESLLVHEFAHQWFGDMISPGTWSDLWLNEGFATWSEAWWWESDGGYTAYKNDIKGNASYYLGANPGFPVYNPEWAVNTPPQGTLFNYAITYCKSACVVHLLRYVLGDDAFFTAIKDYATDTAEFKYKNAVTEDFITKIETSSGVELDWFFDQWVFGPNHPVYDNEYNFKDNGDGTWTVNFMTSQVQTDADFFKMPIEISVYFLDGTNVTEKVMNDENNQAFSFTYDKEPGTLFFDQSNEIVLKTATISVGIDEDRKSISSYHLGQNFPNPVAGNTVIVFNLPKASFVNLSLYDLNGKKLMTMADKNAEAGQNEIEVDLSQLANGTYYYTLKTDNFVSSKKLVLLK
jgi:aminopeptidase N